MSGHRRFLVKPSQINGNEAIIDGGTARQIIKVLRLKEGDSICLIDGTGLEYQAEIQTLAKNEVKAHITSKDVCSTEPAFKLSLAVCLPKSDKLELIVQKATELGIFEIIVVNSERTIAHLEQHKAEERLERWNKIAAEAAEQSGRSKVPEIEALVEFEELTGRMKNWPLSLVAWEEEKSKSLKAALNQNRHVQSALIVVGPEGGFTHEEISEAQSAGAVCVNLGKRLLRTETAAIAMVAAAMYEFEGEL